MQKKQYDQTESQFYYQKHNNKKELKIDYIFQICKTILKQDLLFFLKIQKNVTKLIHNYLRNQLNNKQQSSLNFLVNTILLKIKSVQTYKLIYPQIDMLIRKIVKKIQFKKLNLSQFLEQHNNDILYKEFLNNLKEKNQILYIVKQPSHEKISLEQYVSSCEEYAGRHDWIQFYRITIINYQSKNSPNLINLSIHQLNTIQKAGALNTCIGCYQYFVENQAIGLQQNMNQTILLGSVVNLQSEMKVINMKNERNMLDLPLAIKIRSSVCGILNSKSIGFILFDCSEYYFNILPKGYFLEEKHKNQMIDFIKFQLTTIRPYVPSVKINFVPVISLQQIKYGYSVLRITIQSNHSNEIFFWTDCQQYSKISILDKKKIKILSKQEENIFIQKNKMSLKQSQKLAEEKAMLGLISSIVPHKCIEVNPQNENFCFQIFSTNKINKFKYMSILKCKKVNLAKLKLKLALKKIECLIQSKFQDYNFKILQNYSIFYHNISAVELRKQLANLSTSQFDHSIKLIQVTKFLGLINKFKNQDFQNLKQWLLEQNLNANIKIWAYSRENLENSYFIECENLQSSIFLFYLLNHLQQQSTFLEKDKIDKIKQKQLLYF